MPGDVLALSRTFKTTHACTHGLRPSQRAPSLLVGKELARSAPGYFRTFLRTCVSCKRFLPSALVTRKEAALSSMGTPGGAKGPGPGSQGGGESLGAWAFDRGLEVESQGEMDKETPDTPLLCAGHVHPPQTHAGPTTRNVHRGQSGPNVIEVICWEEGEVGLEPRVMPCRWLAPRETLGPVSPFCVSVSLSGKLCPCLIPTASCPTGAGHGQQVGSPTEQLPETPENIHA